MPFNPFIPPDFQSQGQSAPQTSPSNNPFIPQGFQGQSQAAAPAQTQAPPVQAPSAAQQPAPTPPTAEDKPFSQKFGEFVSSLPTAGPNLFPEQEKAFNTSLAQGAVEAGQNIAQLGADLASKIGLIQPDTAQKLQGSFDTERAQYNNIPYVKNNPNLSNITKGTSTFATEMIPAAKALKGIGLGGTFIKNILQDVGSGAVAGGLEMPSQDSNSPFIERGINAAESGAINGAISSPFRLLGSFKGAPTAERIAEQQANGELLKQVGGGTVGQVIGTSNGLMGERLAATEADAAKLKFIGGDDAFFDEQLLIKQVQQKFVNSLQPNPADISALTPEEVQLAQQSKQPLTDAAIDKAYNNIRQTSANMPPAQTTPLITQLQPLVDTIQGTITKTPADKQLLQRIGDLQVQPTTTFDQLWNFRKALDDKAFSASGDLKLVGDDAVRLKTLRSAVSGQLQDMADQAGIGTSWSKISGQYSQNQVYKQVEDVMNKAYSGLGRGGLTEAKGLLMFAKKMGEEQQTLGRNLTPDQKDALNGMIKLTTLANKQLRKVSPGLDVVASGIALGTGATIGVLANPATALGLGAMTYGLTALLHSNLGRATLTYASKAPMTSMKMQDMALKLLQSGVQAKGQEVTKPIANAISNNQEQIQPQGY